MTNARWYWFLAVLTLCVIAVLITSWTGFYPTGEALNRHVEYIMNAAGIFITSIALLVAAYFIVLAVDVYAHVDHIRNARTEIDNAMAKSRVLRAELSETAQAVASTIAQAQKATEDASQAEAAFNTAILLCLDANWSISEKSTIPLLTLIAGLKPPLIREDEQRAAVAAMQLSRGTAGFWRAYIRATIAHDREIVLTALSDLHGYEDIIASFPEQEKDRLRKFLQEAAGRWGDDAQVKQLFDPAIALFNQTAAPQPPPPTNP